MTAYVPRDYQDLQIKYSTDFIFNNTNSNTGLIGAPTGTGKSIVIGGVVEQVKFYYPQARILMLTHVKELVEQNHEKAQAMCTQHEIGLWSAGLRKKDWHHDIVFAGIDTVAVNPQNLGRRDVILIDEAHRVSPHPNTNYNKVLNFLRQLNPNCKTVGLTATPYRMGQGLLTRDWFERKTSVTHPAFWENMLCDLTQPAEFKKFFDLGYLKRLVPKSTEAEIDVSNLRMRNDEYVQSDIEEIVNNEEKIRAIVDEICANGGDRRSWVVFGAGNLNATLIHKEIARRGVSCAVVTEKTPAAERRAIVDAFKRYEIRCLVNNDIFTTGFDHAGVDLIAVVRVTNSTPLWVQMLGRGTRPVYSAGFDLNTVEGRLSAIFASGVYNCLVLDFAGNTLRLGAINDPVIPVPPSERKQRSAGDVPCKVCPPSEGGCGIFVVANAKICDDCGFIFPLSKEIRDHASMHELIEEEEHVPDIRKLTVLNVSYRQQEVRFGNGSSSTIKVRYNCSTAGKFEETLAFNGRSSTVRTKKWWEYFAGDIEIPESNDAFLAKYAHIKLKRLCALEVYMNMPRKAKPEIIYYGFDDGTAYSC